MNIFDLNSRQIGEMWDEHLDAMAESLEDSGKNQSDLEIVICAAVKSTTGVREGMDMSLPLNIKETGQTIHMPIKWLKKWNLRKTN